MVNVGRGIGKRLLVFGVSTLFILVMFSPVVYSKEIYQQRSVVVEVNRVSVYGVKRVLSEMSYGDACKLKELLIKLNDAIDKGDSQAVEEYEAQLNEMRLFDNTNLRIPVKGVSTVDVMEDNISNSLCYFHAAGKGTILFTLGVKIVELITNAIKNASSLIEALAIAIALLAIFAPFLLITYLVPFRIAMPISVVDLESGRMATLGLNGCKKVVVDENNPLSVTLRWFSGVTVNIPFGQDNESFLFVSGFAFSVEENSF
ncbi:MAG TPA: hypothetical protein ENI42_06780 [Thermoplasmatales archaeon]|nr:hypothetical protein [Thermoplasmatales archaeon]